MICETLRHVDSYLRRPNSVPARIASKVSPITGQDYLNSKRKRAVEIAVTTPAVLVSTPLIAVLALGAWLGDRRNPFFVQERIGKKGQPVKVVKIRSMYCGAENRHSEVIFTNPEIKPHEDPRSTAFGKLLRKTSMDELPQLLQVWMGQISLVGFRIIPQEDVDHVLAKKPTAQTTRWTENILISPSLLSLHAVMSEHTKNPLNRVHYDEFYLRYASLGLDLYILYKSILGISLGRRKQNGSIGGDKKIHHDADRRRQNTAHYA